MLLVILIFLMLSTTYSRFTELQLTLPAANAEQMRERPAEIIVAIAATAARCSTAARSTAAASRR